MMYVRNLRGFKRGVLRRYFRQLGRDMQLMRGASGWQMHVYVAFATWRRVGPMCLRGGHISKSSHRRRFF